MKAKKLMNFALTVGEVMLKNGAETYRVEDTINRILKTSNYTGIDTFVTPTGLFATVDDEHHEHFTYIRRISERRIHLHIIELANKVSRDYCNGDLELAQAMIKIKEVEKEKAYQPLIMIPSIGLAAGLFAIVLGGTLEDASLTLLAGLLLAIMQNFFGKFILPKFFADLLGSFAVTTLVLLVSHYFSYGEHMDLIIISAIMPLVPGVAITNAVRDIMHGDLVSGSARVLDAFIVAASIATGVGIAISAITMLTGGTL